jgi:hypothetical protein
VRLLGEVPVHAGASEHSYPTGAPRPRPALEDKIPDLKSARRGARERLGRPECQAVLTDFVSVNGGRLDQVLRASGRTAQEQLDLMVFESGFGRRGCARSVLASTHVHSSVVEICLRPFELFRPVEQEAVLIHEMLHSLGLGENPPDSLAITKRVMDRCGR